MSDARSGPIFIAGAGIAGLSAALAFAQHGFDVRIFERAERLEEAGAGLQLSPNATRFLARLGVLDRLRDRSVAPVAVVLRDAATLRELARVPLGPYAESRWGAPYLAIHRADLHWALLERIKEEGGIELITDATVTSCTFASGAVAVSVERGGRGKILIGGGRLLIGADGVWSAVRGSAGLGKSRFSGQIAWRVTVIADAARDVVDTDAVTAFLHRRVHLVAYPMRGGATVNLVAVMKGREMAAQWSSAADAAPLVAALRGAEPWLKALVANAGPWSAWPLHVARPKRWTDRQGLALIGDAAHAMTPFAAQGAAMAIEDAVVLADLVATAPGDLPAALARYEADRRPRIARVARRGALNQLAWHASGPVALARNMVLKMRSPERLAADMDWLYGWDARGSTDEAA